MLRTSVRQPVHLNEYTGYMLGLEYRHRLLFACQLTDRTGAAPAVKGEPTPLVGPPPRSRGYRLLQIRGLSQGIGSGIHPAINGEIRAGNVRGLRTGDERHQRGDLINMAVAVERCGAPWSTVDRRFNRQFTHVFLSRKL